MCVDNTNSNKNKKKYEWKYERFIPNEWKTKLHVFYKYKLKE